MSLVPRVDLALVPLVDLALVPRVDYLVPLVDLDLVPRVARIECTSLRWDPSVVHIRDFFGA